MNSEQSSVRKVLVLGAGFVSRPLVKYLLALRNVKVILADLELEKAQRIINRHPYGQALQLNLQDENVLKNEIKKADIVVSLVPNDFHSMVAKFCVKLKKHMITTSYVSEAMENLDKDAKQAGIILLNEVGLDPGLDHMEAMRIIHEVKRENGNILKFTSFCGGLPAPEANTNPFGYKFSWSPRGVLLASKSSARYLSDEKEIFVSSENLFDDCSIISIKGLGEFEGYPNRNSLPYIEIYGIPETKTMFRGTLRYSGWCKTLKKIIELGLLDETEKDWSSFSYKDFLRNLLGQPAENNLKKALGDRLKINENSDIIQNLEWLGLLSEEKLPVLKGSALDILEARMKEKLGYKKGERDMVILQHEIIATYPSGKTQKIISILIDFGIPYGDSSMARTVGLPAAMSTRLILEGNIQKTGVSIPVFEEIYRPVLRELKEYGISFKEEREID